VSGGAAGAVATPAADASPFERARVREFNAVKGYGFLTRGAGTPDIFIHKQVLRWCNMPALLADQMVLVRSVVRDKALVAIEVRPDHAPDPILAAIARMREAEAAFDLSLDEQALLEKSLPRATRRSGVFDLRDGTLAPGDDPRWIACITRVDELSDATDERAEELLKVAPTTLAGLAVLLHFAYEYEATMIREWPGTVSVYPDRNGYDVSWSSAMHKHAALALDALASR
jgi:cold shock CspA family protein